MSSPSSRRRRSSGCGSATPSAAGCASPPTATSRRAFERAVVRARLPMAYSSGFHPHPRISYAGAAPTGAASEAEYLEIGLAEVVDPADVAAALAEALPDGLDVLTVVESPGRLAGRPAHRQPVDGPACRASARPGRRGRGGLPGGRRR